MNLDRTIVALAGALTSACGTALGVPTPKPVYTFCEIEDNDLCSSPQILDASQAVIATGDEEARDFLFVTGKLQKDCVWDRRPKCMLRAYDKPAPCRDSTGAIIAGAFYEPSIASSAAGRLTALPVLSDGSVRLAVTSVQDGFDGTANGLANNGPHGERGAVKVNVFYRYGGAPPASNQPDEVYTADFLTGSDAFRVALRPPAGVTALDVVCDDDEGTVELCWDVDHYLVQNLIPSKPYSIRIVAAKEEETCYDIGALLGVFDKNCWLHSTDPQHAGCYAQLFTYAEVDGSLRFAVTGDSDYDFDGLHDLAQAEYRTFLRDIGILYGLEFVHRTGASAKDASAVYVPRYSDQIWADRGWMRGSPPELKYVHGVCGEYCVEITLAEHVSPSDPRRPFVVPLYSTSPRADLNGDGHVNASDLALLLSFWGQRP